jgi:hypothetical protein
MAVVKSDLVKSDFGKSDMVKSNTVKSKTKAIVFRITEEDYARLESKTQASGARSLSEFARSKLLRAVGEPSLAEVGRKLSELEKAVQQLAEMFAQSEAVGRLHGD